jgi:hypothetical protein
VPSSGDRVPGKSEGTRFDKAPQSSAARCDARFDCHDPDTSRSSASPKIDACRGNVNALDGEVPEPSALRQPEPPCTPGFHRAFVRADPRGAHRADSLRRRAGACADAAAVGTADESAMGGRRIAGNDYSPVEGASQEDEP